MSAGEEDNKSWGSEEGLRGSVGIESPFSTRRARSSEDEVYDAKEERDDERDILGAGKEEDEADILAFLEGSLEHANKLWFKHGIRDIEAGFEFQRRKVRESGESDDSDSGMADAVGWADEGYYASSGSDGSSDSGWPEDGEVEEFCWGHERSSALDLVLSTKGYRLYEGLSPQAFGGTNRCETCSKGVSGTKGARRAKGNICNRM